MSAKIGYRVIFASSHENGHDSQELEIRNNIGRGSVESNNKAKNKGKGWQSARFCNYPQDLVIGLEAVCEISQIQILSHQSKIASKVEIWVGLDNNNHSYSTYKSINWKRLGYLSLDKNERSNWKARELKSVYINTTANYIKFSLHESHINTINLFNQIGFVALTVLGKKTNNNNNHHQIIINDENNLNNLNNNKNNNSNKNDNNNNNNNSNTKDIDEYTSQKISELQALKIQAVDNEDYDEAKRCKICIENLRHAAKELLMLEKQKKIAVQKEDYDSAKALKLQIERLRSMSLNIENPNININTNTNIPLPIYSQPIQQAINNHQYANISNISPYNCQPPNSLPICNMESPNSVCFVPTPTSVHQPQHIPQQQQQQQIIPIAMVNGQVQQRVSHSHSHSHSQSQSMSPNLQHNRSLSLNPDDRQIRPMKRNYNTIDVTNANPFGDDDDNNNDNNNNIQQNAIPVIPEARNGQRPPPLKASVKNGSEKSIEMFGEYTLRLLNSQNWNHRDEGLKKIITFLNKKEHPDSRQVFRLTAKTIHSLLQDRVAGVVLSAIDTLNTLINVYDNDSSISSEECCKSLHSIIQILVNILGNNNNRLIDGSGSILISLCHHNELLCRSIFQVLIKKMKKILPKHLRGRGLILLQLIPQFNIPKSLDVNSMMDNLIQAQLINKNGDIRDIGIQITCLLYQIVDIRNRVVKYLENANLNDFIKESLNNSFKQVSGKCNVLEREPKSIKEQSRPSKTMNQTNQKKNNKKPQPKKRKKKKITKKQEENININNKQQQLLQQEQEEEEEEEEEEEDVCNFCGLRDISFIENEENLDLHYWQSCPMLTSCKLCEQVIEIATLHEHILTECESGVKHELCNKCNIPYEINNQHECPSNINLSLPLCPLCLNNINSSQPQAWKLHLLKYPGCKSNPRPSLQ